MTRIRAATLVAGLAAALFGLHLLLASGARAEHGGAGSTQAGVTLSLQQGDYGSDTTQTVTELSALLRLGLERGEVRIAVPYLWLRTDPPDAPATSVSGMGDVRIDGRWTLLPQAGARPALRLLGGLKLPTADDQKGLGTGEADVTLGAGLDAFVTDDAFWFADADYTRVGEPPGIELDNQWRLALGAGSYLGTSLVLSGALEQRSALVPGGVDPRELLLGAAWIAPIGWQATLSAGLSDGAPDYGVSAGVYATF